MRSDGSRTAIRAALGYIPVAETDFEEKMLAFLTAEHIRGERNGQPLYGYVRRIERDNEAPYVKEYRVEFAILDHEQEIAPSSKRLAFSSGYDDKEPRVYREA